MNPIDKYELEKWLEDKASLELIAKSCKVLYDNFEKVGFSKQESLKLAISIINAGQNKNNEGVQ